MDSRSMRMDSEFDKYLVDMKPYLLNLHHKAERQRCALWIKKLCEPVGSSIARKNRNMHAKLLLHMLKRGVVDGPFATRPDTGILKSLPSYMSIFFDEPVTSGSHFRKGNEVDKSHEEDFKAATTPDWAREELPFSTSEALTGVDENLSFLENYRSTPLQAKHNHDDPEYHGDHSMAKIPDFRAPRGTSTFRDQQSLINIHEKELEMKTKLLQAGFHEEKLNLQHKHDIAVQKILDRKNNEIDELKRHYKSKEKEYDETKRKLEKKLQSTIKVAQESAEAKDRQVDDATALADDVRESLRAEYDAKIHDMLGTMEREKYELQKSHTKNIQELLDDTNRRLASMEDEYNSQTQATKVVVCELEQHVSQLSREAEAMASAKQLLQAEKQQLEIEQSRIVAEAKQANRKCEELQEEVAMLRDELSTKIRSIQSKSDANVEYLMQEHKVNTARAQDTVREMEDQVQNLRHALQDSEQQRSREVREKDSLHQQDMMSAQHLHEKQLHSFRAEWDQERSQHSRAVKALEDTIKDKDEEIVKLTMTQKQCTSQAEQAIERYKKQASDAQQKVYSDMKSQLERMEADLEQSRITRDQLQVEFKKQIEEIKERHNDEITESRVMLEHEKGVLAQRFNTERDRLVKEYEKQLSMAEARLREALEQQEKVAEERRFQHQEVVSGLELQIRELREELVSANALRRQQLVELGLLREEERQKASRDHDIAVAKLEAEIDRQRSELHQQHAAELERQAQKIKSKIENLEAEHQQQMERVHERLMDAQNKEAAAREMLVQSKNDAEEQILSTMARLEDEGNHLKMQHHHHLMNAQSELEKLKDEYRVKTRHFQQLEFDLKNELSRVKLECEERTKDMMPRSLKLDLEETIACLRSQVKSLQQRIEVLQDEVNDDRAKSLATSDSYRL